MTSSLPAARPPTAARVAATASAVRYMLTPSQLTSAGRLRSNPSAVRRSGSGSVSRSTPTNVSPSGGVMLAAASRSRFQLWVAGWSTSNTRIPPTSGER